MPKSELVETSRRLDSRASDVLRRWLVIFGEIYGREITRPLVETWCRLLADIDRELLERACEAVAKTSKFFPTPADIRAQFDQADAAGFQLEAEASWETALEHARTFYFPDWGLDHRAPAVAPAIEFGVKACGGWRRLHMCSEDDLVWCRKTFLERYEVLHQTQRAEHLLTKGEAREILRRLVHPEKKAAQLKALPAPQGSEPQATGPEQEVPANFRAPSEKLGVRSAVERETPSAEEWEVRKREQKQRLEAWLAEHRVAEQTAGTEPTTESRL